VGPLRARSATSLSAEAVDASLFAHVSSRGRLLPTRVTGQIHGVPVGRHHDLALAVNGRIRAVGRSFDLTQKQREFFSFLVPETALRPGANRLELFAVRAGGTLARIGAL
jgi:hypothetical protein